MPKAAIYARYSTDEQRATSIEDQVRRAKEHAERLGYIVPKSLIFVDAAISGTAKAKHKREGYARLLQSWGEREFDALVVDELSRLTRDRLEFAQLEERIERSNVHVLSTDGFDSKSDGWEMVYGLKSMMASHFIKEHRHRVMRAMVGQLERGFMIGAPPFGYKGVQHQSEGKDIGTTWQIVEEDAAWVKTMFNLRKSGRSFQEIARHLNQNGVRLPRAPRKEKVGYWRPATVRQILSNTIYRGVFVLNGSAFSRAKAKRENRKIERVPYARPDLRIVDDEVWYACSPKGVLMRYRGGCKHVFAGLVHCGVCGAKLTVNTGGDAPMLYCAQCDQAKRVGVPDRKSFYGSAKGLQQALLYVLQEVITPHRIEIFRERLQQRLEGGKKQAVEEVRTKLAQLEKTLARLRKLLDMLDGDDDALTKEYVDVSQRKRECKLELAQFEAVEKMTNVEDIKRQLEVNPVDLLPQIFSTTQYIDNARSVLMSIFKRIELMNKLARNIVIYRITVVTGALPALLTKTSIIDTDEIVLNVKLTSSSKRPVSWDVEIFD